MFQHLDTNFQKYRRSQVRLAQHHYNKAPERETGSFIQISQDEAVSHFVAASV